jgi:hypothetical protein
MAFLLVRNDLEIMKSRLANKDSTRYLLSKSFCTHFQNGAIANIELDYAMRVAFSVMLCS